MKGFLYHTAAAMRREIGRIARMRMYRMLLFYLPLADGNLLKIKYRML